MGRKATAPEHGYVRYAKRECSCDVCKKDWARYIREYKARTKQKVRIASSEAHYIGQTERVSLRLTPLAASVVRAYAARKGMGANDVVEQALRHYASI